MASKTVSRSTMVSDDMLDEVWMMMHMAAEMGTHHVPIERVSAQGGSDSKFYFEAEVEDDYIEEVTHPDDEAGKERALINVAERLMEIGDGLNKTKKKKQDVEELSKEIADHIKNVMGPDVERRLASKLSRSSATDVFNQTGVLSLVYNVFKEKVSNFVGVGEDVTHIALVTHITRGIAAGLEQSSSGVAGLLATVSTLFVQEKYGNLLQKCKEKGGLVHVVDQSKQDLQKSVSANKR